MGWMETCAVDERMRFVMVVEAREEAFAAVCRRFGVSRKSGYKWLERYGEAGVEGLVDRSRAPLHHPQAMTEESAERCLAVRRAHPTWGPVKVRAWLERRAPQTPWPVASTIGALFDREGLTVRHRLRSDNGPPFASRGAGGLSKLSVKVIKAGVVPERIAPGKPQQNGRLERLHLTLLQDTANPPARSLREQLERLRSFQSLYNEERPHEALGNDTPAEHYAVSARCFDGVLREPSYGPDHAPDRVVGPVARLAQDAIEASRRDGVVLGRGVVAEGLVRALFIVEGSEAAQALELLSQAPRRRVGGVLQQRQMQPLQSTVLLRLAGRNALRHHPGLDHLDRQLRQPARPARGKRRSIVGAQPMRKAELAECRIEHWPYVFGVGARHRLAAQQIPAVGVAQRQRLAMRAVAG